MKKISFLIPTIFFIIIISISALYAKTSDEYAEEIYKLIDQKKYDEALALVDEGAKDYPGDLGLAVAFAEINHLKGNYETAIANYINIMKAISSPGPEILPNVLAHYHHNLVDAYNELGQKHYFSKELCLRIIYHAEKVMELMPEASQDSQYVGFLRKSIGHYDVASMGSGNVKMMETGGDGADFQLPADYVSDEEKMRYKDKAVQRIKEHDSAMKQNSFQAISSDKTVDELMQLIDQRMSAIKAIHFKRINTAKGANSLLEEVTYKSPDKLKVVEPGAITIINNIDYCVLDPETKKVFEKNSLDPAKISLMNGLEFYNLREVLGAYNLVVEKISLCPDFLSEVCKSSPIDLYLVTAKLKDKDKGGAWPTTPKIEYFIDGRTGLCLAKRDYWLGVLGSGKEEELAKEIIVTGIQNTPEGIYLPSTGRTRGYVEELANLKEDWIINILAINQEIDDQEFSVSK